MTTKKRIKDWDRLTTLTPSDDVIPLDGPDGTRAVAVSVLAQLIGQYLLSSGVTTLPINWASIIDKPSQFAPTPHQHATNEIVGLDAVLDDIETVIATLAPLASPALTGNPTAPTQTVGNNSTRIATTAFVKAAIDALINASPGALDTLAELAAAMGNDPDFATTVTNAIAGKLAKSANLSDLTNAATARTNLGLGAIALLSAVANIDMATMPSGTVKANLTGGAATPSDVTLSALLDLITTTQGSILYRSGTGWQALAPSTSGNILTSQGAGANPQWAAPGAPGTHTHSLDQITAAGASVGNVPIWDGSEFVPGNQATQIVSQFGDEYTTGWNEFPMQTAAAGGAFDAFGEFTASTSDGRFRDVIVLSDIKQGGLAVGESMLVRFLLREKTGTFYKNAWDVLDAADVAISGRNNLSFNVDGDWCWFEYKRLNSSEAKVAIDIGYSATAGTLRMRNPQFTFFGDGARPSQTISIERSRLNLNGNLFPPGFTATNGSNVGGKWTLTNNGSVATAYVGGLSLATGVPYVIVLDPEKPWQGLRRLYLEVRNGVNSQTIELVKQAGGRWAAQFTPVLAPTATATFTEMTVTGDNRNPSPASYTPADYTFRSIQLYRGTDFPAPAGGSGNNVFASTEVVVLQSTDTFNVYAPGQSVEGNKYVQDTFVRQVDAPKNLTLWAATATYEATRNGPTSFSIGSELIQTGGKGAIIQEVGKFDLMGPDPHGDARNDVDDGFTLLTVDGAVKALDGLTSYRGQRIRLIQKYTLYRVLQTDASPVPGTEKIARMIDIHEWDGPSSLYTLTNTITILANFTSSPYLVTVGNINRFKGKVSGNPLVAGSATMWSSTFSSASDFNTIDLSPGFATFTPYGDKDSFGVAGDGVQIECRLVTGWDLAGRNLLWNSDGTGGPNSAKPYFNVAPGKAWTAGETKTFVMTRRITVT